MSEKDVKNALKEKSTEKIIVDNKNNFLKILEINDILKAPYRRCKTCYARRRCSRAIKNNKIFADVECPIEKEALDIIINRLQKDGVTSQDEILVFPVIRHTFQLIRLYDIETMMDLGKVIRNEDAMKIYKDVNGIIQRVESHLIKFLKELTATKKEDQKKTVRTIKSNKFDLAKKLGAKKNANKIQST